MAKYICGCGKVVERKPKGLTSARCFDCRAEANRLRARLYALQGPMHSKEEREQFRNQRIEKYKAQLAKIQAHRLVNEKTRKEREQEIVDLRLQGKTLEEIAHYVKPEITRERVRQILAKITSREGIVFPHAEHKNHRISTACRFCGQPKLVNQSAFKGEGNHWHRGCYKSKFLNPDGTKMSPQEIARFQYHNIPGRKEKHKVFAARYMAKVKADPEKWKRHIRIQNEYSKKWLAEKAKDPVFVEMRKAKGRERYAAIKKDPVKYAELLKKDRERAARRKAKLSPPAVLPPKAT